MANRFKVETIFKAEDRMSRVFNKLSRSSDSITGKFGRMSIAASKMSRVLPNSLRSGTAAMLGMGAGLAVVAAGFKSVLTEAAEFDQSISAAAAKSRVFSRTAVGFNQLKEAAREAGRTTEFTASQSAEALMKLAEAGLGVEGSISALTPALQLATLSGMDFASATDISLSALGAFGLKTKDAAENGRRLVRVNQALAVTASSAQLGLTDISEAMQDGAVFASSMKAPMEDVLAIMAGLSEAGVKGTRAGTGIKNILTRMVGARGEVSDILSKHLGVEMGDAAGKLRPIAKIFNDINKALEGKTDIARASILERVFGKIALPSAVILLDQGAEALQGFSDKIKANREEADAMAKLMRGSFLNQLKRVSSAFADMQIGTFYEGEGTFREAVDSLAKSLRTNGPAISKMASTLFKGFTEVFKLMLDNPKTVIIMAGLITTIGATLATFTIALSAANAATTFFTSLGLANAVGLGVLTFKIIMITGFLVALALAMAAIVIYHEEWTSWIRENTMAFKVFSLVLVALILIFSPMYAVIAAIVLVVVLLVAELDSLITPTQNWAALMEDTLIVIRVALKHLGLTQMFRGIAVVGLKLINTVLLPMTTIMKGLADIAEHFNIITPEQAKDMKSMVGLLEEAEKILEDDMLKSSQDTDGMTRQEETDKEIGERIARTAAYNAGRGGHSVLDVNLNGNTEAATVETSGPAFQGGKLKTARSGGM